MVVFFLWKKKNKARRVEVILLNLPSLFSVATLFNLSENLRKRLALFFSYRLCVRIADSNNKTDAL